MTSPPFRHHFTFDFLNKGDLVYVYQQFNYLMSVGRIEDAVAFEEEYIEIIDLDLLKE
jgi:hypothetical protein|tara:strand:- start:82 stop:255 length:174 start_codon:yes stop_codon:yes gene_type:complete